ncbi:MAG: DUF4340 domain-containing protein [Acidobacteria bacterium]|uniref:DUF4340 domain-containing protein n=1 Tax=Candidatus Polarisedimenticola svalbardensis TaxID=2886004 RepID=A0A8J7CDU3_9BACT|nr:DUF4340 domain-containing protein [Candidatus Polarisedimenticola svalbardensis]
MRKILVALAILVAAAVGFYLVMERKDTRERQEDSNRRLLTLDERAVSEVRARVGEVEWVVIRDGEGTWSIEAPIRDPADSGAVMNLLRLMNQTEVMDTIEEPEQLSAYGLDPARAEIRVVGVSAPVLFIGSETPTRNGIFMRVEGRPGVLVGKAEMDSPFLNPDPSRLRERTLTGMQMNDIRRVSITESGDSVILEKDGEQWWITGPRRLPASQAVLTSLLEALGNAEVAGFIDEADPAEPRFRLGDTALVVGLAGNSVEREIRLGAGTDAGVRFASRTGREAIMAVFGERLFAIPQGVDAFLDSKLTKANRYKVRWFRYETDDGTLEVRRDPEREIWLAEDGREYADSDVFPMLVRLLEGRLLGWRQGSGPASQAASLEYEQEDGLKDRLVYGADGTVSLQSLPGVVFTARVRLPELPG